MAESETRLINNDAEESVIGCLLSGDRPEIYDMLSAEMFESITLGELFHSMKRFFKAGNQPDLVFADEWFKKRHINGNDYLKEIVNLSPAGYEAVTDAKIIREKYIQKQVAEILVVDTNKDIYNEIDRVTKELNSITDVNKGSVDISKCDNADLYEESDTIHSGFYSIDETTDGFEKGDLITIGARPSVGKSAFVLQMAVQMVKSGKKVAYYNLEMPQKQVRQRLLSHLSGLVLNKIKHPSKLNEQDTIKFDFGVEELSKLNGFYLANDLKDIASIRRDVKKKKPDVAIVDYLQLVKVGNRYSGNRYAEVGEISHALKNLAMEMNIPVVVLVQLNRTSAGKEDKEPGMAEIRESGDIEQDSSIIILLWDKDTGFPKVRKGVKIEKNRQGVGAKFEMKFNGALMQFDDREWRNAESNLPFTADRG